MKQIGFNCLLGRREKGQVRVRIHSFHSVLGKQHLTPFPHFYFFPQMSRLFDADLDLIDSSRFLLSFGAIKLSAARVW
jgi:hypothetical protein